MRHRFLIFGLLVFSYSAFAGALEDGLKAYENGRYSQAIEWLTPLAKQNNPQAQFRIGMMNYHGQGTPESEKLAVDWLKKAAAQGYTEAMFELGNVFLVGNQATQLSPDPDREAAIWYNKAAEAGHASAQYHLGLLFLAGNGVIKNDEYARLWFKRAANQGHVEAQKSLGVVSKRN